MVIVRMKGWTGEGGRGGGASNYDWNPHPFHPESIALAVRACVCACVRACVRVCVCMCVCVRACV